MADAGHSVQATTCEPTIFNFQGTDLRVVERDDAPWFVARDVAGILGYTNPRKAIRDHCKAAVPVGRNDSFPPAIDPQTTIIPERDVYRLIMRSKLPAAERFEEWVVGEVLPAIRKTGSYAAPKPAPSSTDVRFERVLTLAEKLVEALTITAASHPVQAAPAIAPPQPTKRRAKNAKSDEQYIRTKDAVRIVTGGQKLRHADIVAVGRNLGKFCQDKGHEVLLFQNRRIYPQSAVDAWLEKGGREFIQSFTPENGHG